MKKPLRQEAVNTAVQSSLSSDGFKPAHRRIGGTEVADPRRILKRLPRRGNAKGFS